MIKSNVNMLYSISKLITIIGALNWGVVGITSLFGRRFEVFEYIFIHILNLPILVHLVYIIIAIFALIFIFIPKDK